MNEHLIDTIIVNYKSTAFLRNCLRSIYRSLNGITVKIFIQDNRSDEDLDPIQKEFPHLIVTKNLRNIGFAGAINQALDKCRAPYVVIVNPDTILLSGFFESIIEFMEERPDVGILGPKIFNNDGSVQGSARSFPNLLTALFGRTTLLTKYLPQNPITRSNVLTTLSDGRSPMEVDWVSGACLVVRRDALEEVGHLDTRFFLYWEDADWCRRMRQGGWKVVYYPKARVMHHVGGSSEKSRIRSVIAFHKSCYRLLGKYSTRSTWLLKPIIISALSIRMLFVFSSLIWRRPYSRFVYGVTEGIGKEAVVRRKIKVLRIIARLNIGGPAIHVHLLTRGLNSDKFQSILVTGQISPHEGDMSYLFGDRDQRPILIPALQREISPWKDLKGVLRIFNILVREKPHIVHTHTAKAGTTGRMAVILYRFIFGKDVKCVHTFHGHVLEGYFGKVKSWVFRKIEKILAKRTDRIIAISDTQKRELSEKYGIAPATKIQTVELGFNLSPFLSNKDRKREFRKNIEVKDDTLLIGIIGRLVPIKNHRMFLDGAKLFIEQNPQIKVKFVVIGDGELKEELEAYSQLLGISEQVIFCGWIEDIAPVYADLDILSLTSINEGTPVSIIEAMASSVPVITTDAGGVRDLLGPNKETVSSKGFSVCERGILCRKNDSLGFAGGLKYLTEIEERDKKELLRLAQKFVEEKFSERRLLEDIASLYIGLVKKPMKGQEYFYTSFDKRISPPKISLLLPTRERPTLVQRFFNSIVEQTEDLNNVEVVLYIDEDDKLSETIQDERINLVKIIGPQLTMGYLITECLKQSTGDIIMLVNDDMVFRTKAWDRTIVDLHKSLGDKVYLAYGNDLFKKGQICTFPILSRMTCKAMVNPFPEQYLGQLIDYHLFDIFKRLKKMGHDRIFYFKDLVFEHMHYRKGKAPFDAIYQHKGRFKDDDNFLILWGVRQATAQCLTGVINGKDFFLSSLQPKPIEASQENMVQAFAVYFRTFIFDKGLPWLWRYYLFVWFCGRYLASKGYLRWLGIGEH